MYLGGLNKYEQTLSRYFVFTNTLHSKPTNNDNDQLSISHIDLAQ